MPRAKLTARPIDERIKDWSEVYVPMGLEPLKMQASRCMNCGVPFCSNGCPLGNLIPDWNGLVHEDQWEAAYRQLERTNPFPEFTGKLCPAPCEDACVLGINDSAVTIKSIEMAIIDRAFEDGWVKPASPLVSTGYRVAVIGSGPCGLSIASQLRRAGHEVEVFEKSDRLGGLIRYGVPDYKMAKSYIDRRIELLEAMGIEFHVSAGISSPAALRELKSRFDAVALCVGAEHARELEIPGRELAGIHLAMRYLTAANRACQGEPLPDELNAHGRRVVILGGGDTGADCYGTALRQGAASVAQFDNITLDEKAKFDAPWPRPKRGKHSPVHDEGGTQEWSVQPVGFEGANGQLTGLRTYDVRLEKGMRVPVPDSGRLVEADMVLLAIGFLGSNLDQLDVKTVSRRKYATNIPGVFVAGDARRGPSLIVWAIAEGRDVAHEIDRNLMGVSRLKKSSVSTGHATA